MNKLFEFIQIGIAQNLNTLLLVITFVTEIRKALFGYGMINRLQYISQEINGKSHLENITEACKAGVKWVQLRIKDKPLDEIATTAAQAKAICKKHGAILIINQHVEIAKKIKANGVHLDKTDMSIEKARDILGDEVYIGGTASTWDEVLKLHYEGVDYIALELLKSADAKDNLSPLLGIKGFSNVMNNMIINDMDTPIIAIGGIELEDIFDLQMTGVHGIAVGSLINQSNEKSTTVEEINQLLLNDDIMPEDHDDLQEYDFEHNLEHDFKDEIEEMGEDEEDQDDPFSEFQDEMDY